MGVEVKPAGASNVNSLAYAGAGNEGPGWLTPEALMYYCQSKIRDIDSQVQKVFKGQQNRGKLSEAVSKLQNELSIRARGMSADDEGGKRAIISAYDAAIEAAGGPTTKLGAELNLEKQAFERTSTGKEGSIENDTPALADWEMKRFIDNSQRLQGDVNREAELEMIQLQSLMSQRQQSLQVCTNLVQSMNQSMMAIAQNTGK